MIRDREIERLINYIKGLGLKVVLSRKTKNLDNAAAEWYLDNSQITIYVNKSTSKLDTVLSLIHEAGHGLHNIYEKGRKIDPKFEDAVDGINEAENQEMDTKKRHRKTILNNEIAGTKYWHAIYKETNMKFPLWKLEMQMEFDIYQYEVFYEKGKFPTTKESREKIKELKEKYKK